MDYLEERCLVDDGEVILNKKAVYEPTKSQRFRQIVCSKAWAIGILLVIGTVMVAIAVIAAFARPALLSPSPHCDAHESDSTSDSGTDLNVAAHEDPQTYIATNGEPFPWKDLRLPKTLFPETYKIFLHANITESYFIGNIHMTLRVVQETDFIVFHTKDLNISNVKVEMTQEGNNTSTEITILKNLEYPRNEQYYLQLGTKLPASTLVHVHLDFRGSLASLSSMRGFYKSSYNIQGQERFIASTHFEANSARLAFPCLDEPDLKANFTMSIVRDRQHITLFNMPLNRTAPYPGELVVDEYEETVKMSTYLVAFVICDFKNISKTRNGVKVSVFAPADKIGMGNVALDAAVSILEFYGSFFGTPYPLSKLDLIAIPNFAAGAMENWGLITFRESGLLYDPDLSTASAREGVVATVAHELAHQWFGNLVTMKWWNDLWLNEGFATFVENELGTDVVNTSFRKKDSALLSYLDAMAEDSLASSHPIAVPVYDPVEIEAAFDSISYDKGSAIIRMLKYFLQEEPFKRGLSNYLQDHKFGNAETSDLWDSLQKVSNSSNLLPGLNVSKIMDTWTNQMGLPVVTVTRQGGKLQLSQQRFLLRKDSNESLQDKKKYKWIIPFTYTTSEQNKQKLEWLQDQQLELSDPSGTWLKGNIETQGFYRVNYDKPGWRAIIKQLTLNHTVFSVADRIGLIDDVFYLARAGLTDYNTALDMTRYLVNETDYFVLSVGLSHLGFLRQRLYLEEEYDLLKKYTLSLVEALIATVEWKKRENPVDEYLQSLLISTAAALEHQKTIDKALEIFQFWKDDIEFKISNGVRYTVYSQGVKHGTTSDWDLILERYRKEVVPSERRILLKALAASHDARLLQRLLKYGLNDSVVKSQDSQMVLTSVAGSNNGQLLAWRFLRENYNTIYERFGSGSFLMADIIRGTIASFNSQFDYDEVANFFKNKKLGSAKRTLEQSKEYIQSHIDWANDYMTVVKTWLKTVV